MHSYHDGILPKGPYPPCLHMADRALLAGYPRSLVEVRSGDGVTNTIVCKYCYELREIFWYDFWWQHLEWLVTETFLSERVNVRLIQQSISEVGFMKPTSDMLCRVHCTFADDFIEHSIWFMDSLYYNVYTMVTLAVIELVYLIHSW